MAYQAYLFPQIILGVRYKHYANFKAGEIEDPGGFFLLLLLVCFLMYLA